jgi:predicted 3-demethylubiquinone-9 3-methyltransferase (glyoxalase superfamily)
MSKITPCLWFDGNAEEAANFYVTLLPDSHVDNVQRSPAETPSGPEGAVLIVEFTLAGQKFVGLNGGPLFKFNEAVSFQIHTEDQAETDRDRQAFGGARGGAVRWVKDRSACPADRSQPVAPAARRLGQGPRPAGRCRQCSI